MCRVSSSLGGAGPRPAPFHFSALLPPPSAPPPAGMCPQALHTSVQVRGPPERNWFDLFPPQTLHHQACSQGRLRPVHTQRGRPGGLWGSRCRQLSTPALPACSGPHRPSAQPAGSAGRTRSFLRRAPARPTLNVGGDATSGTGLPQDQGSAIWCRVTVPCMVASSLLFPLPGLRFCSALSHCEKTHSTHSFS